MKLTSSAFTHGGSIPSKYTCDGENLNPPLQISDLPPGTKSVALIVDDPDVPVSVRKDRMWVHWVHFNIPVAKTIIIEEDSTPAGISGKSTGGELGYQGPCPPDREHRYFFKAYALDTLLTLAQGATKEQLEKAMSGHILASAELIGRYNRT
jgi:Raf kinase inhibitor-like YbhB/YbcL family protein